MSFIDEGFRSTRWIFKIPKPSPLDDQAAIEALRESVESTTRKHGSSKCRVYNLPHQEYNLPSELMDTRYIYLFYSHNGNGYGVSKRRVEEIVSALESDGAPCEVLPINPFRIDNHRNIFNNFDLIAHKDKGVGKKVEDVLQFSLKYRIFEIGPTVETPIERVFVPLMGVLRCKEKSESDSLDEKKIKIFAKIKEDIGSA